MPSINSHTLTPWGARQAVFDSRPAFFDLNQEASSASVVTVASVVCGRAHHWVLANVEARLKLRHACDFDWGVTVVFGGWQGEFDGCAFTRLNQFNDGVGYAALIKNRCLGIYHLNGEINLSCLLVRGGGGAANCN